MSVKNGEIKSNLDPDENKSLSRKSQYNYKKDNNGDGKSYLNR